MRASRVRPPPGGAKDQAGSRASGSLVMRVRPAHGGPGAERAARRVLVCEGTAARSGAPGEGPVVEPRRGDAAWRDGAARQASLGWVAGLAGAETGAGARALRKAAVAGTSSSRHAAGGSVRAPGRREEPNSGLGARRQAGVGCAGAAAGLPAERGAGGGELRREPGSIASLRQRLVERLGRHLRCCRSCEAKLR